jgi:type IV secretory pathway TrbD component
MSVHQGHGHASALGSGRTRVVIEGVAALVGLAALSATLFGLLTWAVVQLVRMLAS